MALLLGINFSFHAEDTFSIIEKPYSITQNIAMRIIQTENVYVRAPRKRALTWHSSIRSLLDEAKKYRSNALRLDEMNILCEMLSAEFAAEYEGLDKTLPDMSDKAITPALSRNDLLWGIVLSINLNNYAEKYILKNLSDTETIQEELNNIKKNIVDKCKERYEDDTLQKFVEEYKKLFPGKKLLFDHTPPVNIQDCLKLVKNNFEAYNNLDKYSAVAEFADWGENMLNFLILSYDPIFVKEYEDRLASYKKNFKIK